MLERTFDVGLQLAGLGWNVGASQRPLVVLHGYLEQALAWERVVQELDREVWAYDHRGHGHSEHIGPASHSAFWDYVYDLDALLDLLHPDGPVDLLGHSMGGTVASLYAGSRPERVHRLILVEGLGPPDDSQRLVHRSEMALRHKRKGRDHGAPMADLEGAVKRMLRFNSSLDPTFALRLAQRQTESVPGGIQWRWDAALRHRSPRAFIADHFSAWLQAIRAPTLLVDGSESTYNHPERRRHIRDHRHVVLRGCGHLVHHDDPLGLATEITDFLSAP